MRIKMFNGFRKAYADADDKNVDIQKKNFV